MTQFLKSSPRNTTFCLCSTSSSLNFDQANTKEKLFMPSNWILRISRQETGKRGRLADWQAIVLLGSEFCNFIPVMLVVASQTENQSFSCTKHGLEASNYHLWWLGLGGVGEHLRLTSRIFSENIFLWDLRRKVKRPWRWKVYRQRFVEKKPKRQSSMGANGHIVESERMLTSTSNAVRCAVGDLSGNICHWNARNSAADDDPVTNRAALVSNYITTLWSGLRETYLRL